jgi:hypothetical protein
MSKKSALNLDDIFGDVMFTPEGDTVFLSEEKDDDAMLNSGEGDNYQIYASKRDGERYVPVNAGGGLDTTNLADPSKESLVMGSAANQSVPTSQAVPWKKPPQEKNHLQYAAPKKKKGKDGKERK